MVRTYEQARVEDAKEEYERWAIRRNLQALPAFIFWIIWIITWIACIVMAMFDKNELTHFMMGGITIWVIACTACTLLYFTCVKK